MLSTPSASPSASDFVGDASGDSSSSVAGNVASGVDGEVPGSCADESSRAPAQQRTLAAVLEANRGVGPGFDTLRVALSIAVVVWHGVQVSYGEAVEGRIWSETLGGALAASVLPVFFALSGFLVMGSAVRTRSLSTFLSFRILRIAPALTSEVLLSALVLGPLLTTATLANYFGDHQFWRYFGNIVGRITFRLPGVFDDNPSNLVNASLWTIPPELACYGFMVVVIATGQYLHRRRMLVIMLAALSVVATRKLFHHEHLIVAAPGQENLLLCFIVGNLFYLYRERIVLDWRAALAALVAGLYCVQNGRLVYLGDLLLTYAMVFAGMQRIPTPALFRRGDYSYGIYLYGFPVQQTVALLFPATRTWILNAAISLPVIVLFAMFSWHVIERPALAQKKRIAKRLGSLGSGRRRVALG